ncbi:MAG: HepT-like ribonuclease domain-containing protein [Promethearchaeota archaeon]
MKKLRTIYLVSLTDYFIKDDKTKDAVVRNLEIIGEVANQIPMDVREMYKNIQWAQIVGLRHRLIHGYFIVDYDIVWNIIDQELLHLKIKIKDILKDLEENET